MAVGKGGSEEFNTHPLDGISTQHRHHREGLRWKHMGFPAGEISLIHPSEDLNLRFWKLQKKNTHFLSICKTHSERMRESKNIYLVTAYVLINICWVLLMCLVFRSPVSFQRKLKVWKFQWAFLNSTVFPVHGGEMCDRLQVNWESIWFQDNLEAKELALFHCDRYKKGEMDPFSSRSLVLLSSDFMG